MTERSRRAIRTDAGPTPITRFSQGVRAGNIVQVSGQGPLDPATGRVEHLGDVAAQTTATLTTVAAILDAGGASFDDVVMVRVYLTDRADFAAMNGAYEQFVAEHVPGEVWPSRTTVMVGLPLEGMLVEIDVLAVVGD